MLLAKLPIINTCLALTGNNAVNVEEDGTDEWRIASEAYEAGVDYLLGGHDWKFATQIATLQREGDSEDETYEDAYYKPDNALGIVWVKLDNYPTDWKVVGNRILLTAGSRVPKAKYVLQPDPEEMPSLFVEALRCLVMAGCYAGLNEEADEARAMRGEAEEKLALARSRSDREGSPRQVFRSRILARRRGLLVRRP
jgi:hypothetical protein